jgi:hypothetical protein
MQFLWFYVSEKRKFIALHMKYIICSAHYIQNEDLCRLQGNVHAQVCPF